MKQISYIYAELPDLFGGDSIAHALHIGRRRLNRLLKDYIDDRSMVRLKNGVYAKSNANQFEIAAALYKGYIGFSSALYLHGLKTELERMVQICIAGREKPVYFGGVKLMPIQLSGMLYGTELLRGLLVSTYPKTIFDMLLKPRYANFFDMYRALNTRKFNVDEWKELLYYACEANLSTVRRTGLVFEGRAPGWFMKELKALDRPFGRSFFHSKKANNFNSEWRIYDDLNVKRWENAL